MSSHQLNELLLRSELPADIEGVQTLIQEAFKNAEHTDGQESQLVQRLRESSNFIPELSVVACQNGVLLGHIIFTRIEIRSPSGQSQDSLALAPVSVLPEFQKMGIGKALIERGHEVARQLGFQSVIVLGYPDYYSKFGYKKASGFGIQGPFQVPDDVFMALELIPGALSNREGLVCYSAEFEVN
jgi:predicted N-acetyltransferase YhbS